MQVPRSEIKKLAVIDDNTVITFLVEELSKVETQGGEGSKLPAGCLMFKATLRVTEPAKDADLLLYDNFVVGTEEDPDAENPETWTSNRAFGARRLNEFLDALGVAGEDSDGWPEEASEQQGQALVVIQTPDTGKYKGQPQNRIRNYYAIGQAPSVNSKKAAPAGTTAAKPVAKATPAQAAKAATPAAKIATPAKVAAKPPTSIAKGSNSAAKPPVVTKGQQGFDCAICGETIARDEFKAHVQSCMEANTGVPADE